MFTFILCKKYFYVSLGNIFTVFAEAPWLWRPLGNCPVCPRPLNPALGSIIVHGHRRHLPITTSRNTFAHWPQSMRTAQQRLCNCRSSVRPSVRLSRCNSGVAGLCLCGHCHVYSQETPTNKLANSLYFPFTCTDAN